MGDKKRVYEARVPFDVEAFKERVSGSGYTLADLDMICGRPSGFFRRSIGLGIVGKGDISRVSKVLKCDQKEFEIGESIEQPVEKKVTAEEYSYKLEKALERIVDKRMTVYVSGLDSIANLLDEIIENQKKILEVWGKG